MKSTDDLPSLWQNLRRIRALLSRRRKLQLIILFGLLLASAFFEVMTLGSIPPFIAAMSNPDALLEFEFAEAILNALNLTEENQIRFALAGVFAGFALCSAGVRLTYQWASVRLSQAILCDLTEHTFSIALQREWSEHVSENSSSAIAGIIGKTTQIVTGTIYPLMALGGALAITSSVLLTMLLIEPNITLSIGVFAIFFYGAILRILRGKINEISKRMNRLQTDRMQILQAAFGGLREIILDDASAVYTTEYAQIARTMAKDNSYMNVASVAPRAIMELMLIFMVIGIYMVNVLNGADVSETLPSVAFLAFGAMRLLPNAQLIYNNITAIRSVRAALNEALELAEHKPADIQHTGLMPLPFSEQIQFKNVWFRYAPELPWILQGVSLTIRRGERIGIIGITGSGKSSLIDLAMGLLRPEKGNILIDGVPIRGPARRRWMKRIAHVPQTVFLLDESVENNIIFGLEDKPDMDRVRQAAEQAQIGDLIDADTGERGIRLSGGQRQRVGIARALYRMKDVMILDEATSALDDTTETKIMETLDALGKEVTVIMIAHRLTTLKNCDRIIELEQGKIKRIVDGYDNL